MYFNPYFCFQKSPIPESPELVASKNKSTRIRHRTIPSIGAAHLLHIYNKPKEHPMNIGRISKQAMNECSNTDSA